MESSEIKMQTIKSIWNDAERLSSLKQILAWGAVILMIVGVFISSRLNPAVSSLARAMVGLTWVGIAITVFSLLIERRVDKLNKAQNSEIQATLQELQKQRDQDRQDDLGIVFRQGKP